MKNQQISFGSYVTGGGEIPGPAGVDGNTVQPLAEMLAPGVDGASKRDCRQQQCHERNEGTEMGEHWAIVGETKGVNSYFSG